MITQTLESQAVLTSANAKSLLEEGNKRFVKKSPVKRDLITQVKETAEGQYPHSIILSCIDSRIPTEIIFDQGIGDVFNSRVAGNIVNEDVLGSMEFACQIIGSKLIVVLGHTSCGAIKGACDNAKLGNLTVLLDKIKPAVEAVKTEAGIDRSSKNTGFVNQVSHTNVDLTIENIKSQSPVLKALYDEGKIDIVGAMYDVASGKVSFK